MQESPVKQKPDKQNIYSIVKRLISLNIDNIKIISAEKLTILVSAASIAAFSLMLAIIAFIFIAIGISNLLEQYIPPYLSYFIIAGFIILVIALLIIFRTPLVINPVARFISKLIINPPKNNDHEQQQ